MGRFVLLLAAAMIGPMAPVALAGPASGVNEVVAGRDLTAWQILEQRRLTGAAAVDAYRAYLLLHSDSPFAVAAFGRLVELNGVEGTWADDPAVKAIVTTVRRAWEDNQRAVAAAGPGAQGKRTIATIDIADGFVEAP